MKWTNESEELLRQLYPDLAAKELQELFGWPLGSIYNKAKALGVKKSEAFMQSEKSGRIEKLSQTGAEYRFKKGQAGWNKGLKGVYKSSAPTKFKKGHLPHNALEDGAIRIRRDKSKRPYQFIRLALNQWVMLHVHTWEQAHGKVPRGMCVVFKDGNSLNCELDNLELVNRKDLMMRNTIHNYPEEIVSTIKTLSKLKKLINHGKEQN